MFICKHEICNILQTVKQRKPSTSLPLGYYRDPLRAPLVMSSTAHQHTHQAPTFCLCSITQCFIMLANTKRYWTALSYNVLPLYFHNKLCVTGWILNSCPCQPYTTLSPSHFLFYFSRVTPTVYLIKCLWTQTTTISAPPSPLTVPWDQPLSLFIYSIRYLKTKVFLC